MKKIMDISDIFSEFLWLVVFLTWIDVISPLWSRSVAQWIERRTAQGRGWKGILQKPFTKKYFRL